MNLNGVMNSAEQIGHALGGYGQKSLGTTHCSTSSYSESSLFRSIELYPVFPLGI